MIPLGTIVGFQVAPRPKTCQGFRLGHGQQCGGIGPHDEVVADGVLEDWCPGLITAESDHELPEVLAPDQPMSRAAIFDAVSREVGHRADVISLSARLKGVRVGKDTTEPSK